MSNSVISYVSVSVCPWSLSEACSLTHPFCLDWFPSVFNYLVNYDHKAEVYHCYDIAAQESRSVNGPGPSRGDKCELDDEGFP